MGRKRTHALFEKSRVTPVLWLSFVYECDCMGGYRKSDMPRMGLSVPCAYYLAIRSKSCKNKNECFPDTLKNKNRTRNNTSKSFFFALKVTTIDYLRAPLSISFKASLSAKFLLWQLVLISIWIIKTEIQTKTLHPRLALK